MTQVNHAILDGKQMDTGKCRTRIDSAGIAECLVKARCQWVLRVGQSMGLAVHSIKVCRHPFAKQMAEPTWAESAGSKADGLLA